MTVADLGFPRQGANPKGGQQSIILANFLKPLDPPVQCVTDNN